MNELQLIRAQLTTERQHASTVANACATAFGRRNAVALSSGSSLEEFQQACVDYLVRVLAWFEERDQRLADLSHARPSAADAGRRTLEEALASPGRSREALEKLAAALACAAASPDSSAQDSWREFAQFFNSVWSARREPGVDGIAARSEEHTSELQSLAYLVCRLLLEKKNIHQRD